MSSGLKGELAKLPAAQAAHLKRYGFRAERLIELVEQKILGGVDNQVHEAVSAPGEGAIQTLPSDPREQKILREIGEAVLSAGQCALVVLAGGMATRMGGVVKALVPVVDGASFLDLRRLEVAHIGHGCPLWLMTSDATERPILEALSKPPKQPGTQSSWGRDERISTFPQHLSLRVTLDGGLYKNPEGQAEAHASGHGDLPEALKQSGLLERFVAGGGKLLLVTNVDNLGATLDPLLIGWHLSHQKPVSCEVVEKLGSDRGGIPVSLNNRTVILEEFRLPSGFDPQSVSVFNTNTFWIDAETLLASETPWTYFAVTKQDEGQSFIQFERLLGEITSHLDTQFIELPRVGSRSRFLPVKDYAELALRAPDIRQVVYAREIL